MELAQSSRPRVDFPFRAQSSRPRVDFFIYDPDAFLFHLEPRALDPESIFFFFFTYDPRVDFSLMTQSHFSRF